MSLRRLIPLIAVALALAAPATARARGGNYAFDGGTAAQRTQVVAALNASAFDWSVVAAPVTIHIARGTETRALPGHIWLDADLVDAGRFAWGPIQHEYAHQVDFFLLTPVERLSLGPALGATTWWGGGALAHDEVACERFASTLAWSYWPSRHNSLRPTSPRDEAGALPPARFRELLSPLLPLHASR